ncbi:MAG: RNase adapter RapZ [Janthinobacterium lividum]
MRIILITGISGSGKSVALNALEDIGYYCVDNLPPRFLPELAAFLANDGCSRLAVAIDARSGNSLHDIARMLDELRVSGHTTRVLFLNASTQSLIARFSETRRRHPLSVSSGEALPRSEASLADAIEGERELLSGLTELGHQLDTSSLRANTLRAWVRTFAEHQNEGLTLMFQSFGFKKGLPLDADYVFDVRSLPNPYYDTTLRPLTGRDQPVIDFLSDVPEVHEMIEDISSFLKKWLQSFRNDNRSYLTVAIGCTGGQHRSVFIAETLARRFGGADQVILRHREIAPLDTADTAVPAAGR